MKKFFHLRPLTPNIGNDLIALGLQIALRRALGSDFATIVMPVKGGTAVKAAGLSPRSVYEANQLADGIVVGPGNLLENGDLEVDRVALAALRKPLMLFSISLGRMVDAEGRWIDRTDSLNSDLIRAVVSRANTALVRDRATFDAMQRLGLQNQQLGGCPSLWLKTSEFPPHPGEQETAGAVLLSVRHPNLMSVPYEIQGRTYFDVRRLIDRLGKKLPVYLLCHDYRDLSFARAFPEVPALYTEDPQRFIGWLRGCVVNIGYRLHGFLACCALDTPAIHLSYDERGKSLIETVGLGAWNVDLFADDWFQQVEQRLSDLDRLEDLKRDARATWTKLKQIQLDAITSWAGSPAVAKRRAA